MSSAPGRIPSAAELMAALPFFLFLWLGILAFLLCLAFFIKGQLQDTDLREVENRLDSYLAGSPLSGLIDISRRRGEAGDLQGLVFIRFIRQGEQLLVSGTSPDTVDFHRLASLDPGKSGIWISLDDPAKTGSWTIISRPLSSGFVVQAGSDRGLYSLYHRLRVGLWLASIGGGALALVLALVCVRQRAAPIWRMSAGIAAILEEGRTALPMPSKLEGPELTDLNGRLNQLLQYNRQLIAEMQASLDNVAHDLRTPMTRLRAVAEYALQPDRDPEQLRDALSDCLEESERVLSMLRIMMSVAEAESGTMSLQKEEVELAASLSDVMTLYEYVAEDKKITVESRLQPGLTVFADRTRIAQVWANLLDNSIKYGKAGGQVVISTVGNGDNALVVFADDGMGISKAEVHRIWERLYRGDRSRSQPGLGLGLNYVRAVVEAHGGTVGVESELHQGARFCVRLPRLQGESGAESIRLRSQISGA